VSLSYCEVCGVLIPGDQGPVLLPEGVICASCFDSRRAVVPTEQRASDQPEVVQFDCCYCHSLLRLKAVAKRTRVRCPKCSDAFYLHEDGHVEARLEGSKTAVLQQEDVAPLGKSDRSGDKTQPIKRSDVLEVGRQHAMLEELRPKRLDFVDSLPERQGHRVDLDTGKYRRLEPAGALDVLADDSVKLDLAGGDAPADPRERLRASEEGHVDLAASELRRKTGQLRPVSPKPRKRKSISDRGPASPKRPGSSRREQAPLAGELEVGQDPGASSPAPSRPRRGVALLLWLAFLLPLAGGAAAAVAAHQRAPVTTQGRFGQGLHDMGRTLEDGVRSLDSFMPSRLRMALPQEGQVAPVDSQ
jgi:hypothetical protein